jgi:hypothetical protein
MASEIAAISAMPLSLYFDATLPPSFHGCAIAWPAGHCRCHDATALLPLLPVAVSADTHMP